MSGAPIAGGINLTASASSGSRTTANRAARHAQLSTGFILISFFQRGADVKDLRYQVRQHRRSECHSGPDRIAPHRLGDTFFTAHMATQANNKGKNAKTSKHRKHASHDFKCAGNAAYAL
jgi:hypothetical protein